MLAAVFTVSAVLAATPAVAKPAAGKPQTVTSNHLYGDYLAGRQAQHRRDFANAAKFYEKALVDDPDSAELISRAFLTEVLTGNFDRAGNLASKELKLDPSDAVAHLVTVVARLKSNDPASAVKAAAALPSDGVHRFVAPFALQGTFVENWLESSGELLSGDDFFPQLPKPGSAITFLIPCRRRKRSFPSGVMMRGQCAFRSACSVGRSRWS